MQARCAEGHYQPSIVSDEFQSWHLIRGSESDGWTTLEFWRLLRAQNGPCDISIEKVIHLLTFVMCSALVQFHLSMPSGTAQVHLCIAISMCIAAYYVLHGMLHFIADVSLYSCVSFCEPAGCDFPHLCMG